MNTHLPSTDISEFIYFVRDQKVMLDEDLARLYGVTTKALVQAMKRNLTRFPPDFMFQLSNQGLTILRSQIVTSSWVADELRRLHFPSKVSLCSPPS